MKGTVKRVGIIGVNYESIMYYYKRINEQMDIRAGRMTTRDLTVRHLDFDKYSGIIERGDLHLIESALLDEFNYLFWKTGRSNSCDYIVIASNTLHNGIEYVVDDVFGILRKECAPFIHIGDCVAEKCRALGVKKVVLFGTSVTTAAMGRFMEERLRKNGLEVIDALRDYEIEKIDNVISNYRRYGSKDLLELRDICMELASRCDCEGIILGSTELELMLLDNWYFHESITKSCGFRFISPMDAHIDKVVDLCLSE